MAMAYFLVACTKLEGDSSTGKDSGGNVLRFDVWGPIGSLNPITTTSGSTVMIAPFLNSYLFRENEQSQLKPDLATSWRYDSETFTWTITLREGALFHNGKSVTASDVKYSIQNQLHKCCSSLLSTINQITAIDNTGLTIVLNHDMPDFLKKIWSIDILPQPDGDDIGSMDHPIGAGPFKFDYQRGTEEVGLVVNTNYHGAHPSLDRVIFYSQPDKERSWARLLAGKTDLALGIDPQDYERINRYRGRFHFNTSVEPFRILILYNIHSPLFADLRVRLAVANAIDKEHLTKNILKGMGMVPSGTMGYYSPFRNPALQAIPHDPEKSLRLLHDAGWTYTQDGNRLWKEGIDFEFNLLFFQENQLHETIAQYIRLCLNDIGIRVHLQPVPFDKLVQSYYRNDAFHAVLTEFIDIRDDYDFLRELWSPVNGGAAVGGLFEDPHVSSLLSCARQESDPLKRQQILYEVDALLTALQPATFLCQRSSLNVLSSRFEMPRSFSHIYTHFHLWDISLAVQ